MQTGLFWIICESKEALARGDFEVLACFDGEISHKEYWEIVRRENKALRRFGYDYYPRGRVQINGNGATVYLNPNLDVPNVTEQIFEAFDLDGEINVCREGTAHYKCFLERRGNE